MPARGTHLTTKTVTLTPKQREVMSLLAKGHTNYEISQALGLSLDGAKYHVGEILARLGVETREAAVEAWRRHTSLPERLRRGLLTVPMVLAARFATAVAVVVVIAGAAAIAVAIVLDGDGSTPAAPADPSPVTYSTPSPPGKGPPVLWKWSWDESSARIWLTAEDDVVALAVSGRTAPEYPPHPGAIVLLDADSGTELWRFETPARAYPAAILPDLVVAGTADGTVFALICGGLYYLTPGAVPASTAWLQPQGPITAAVALPNSIVIAASIGGESPTWVRALDTR